MLSNETIQNNSLLRPQSKSNRKPFLVPIKDSISTSTWLENSGALLNRLTSAVSSKSKKSVTIMRPESIKRANNDACMAAAIGDLEWLKQSLRLSSELAFDKNGLATIHLAAVNCRMNILKYLIEELNVDVNYPSMNKWRPIHLVISEKNGKDAYECIKYLIEKGAEINVLNEDNVSPLHQAASEGHYECLKILLDNNADPFVLDYRGQLPIDLAKIWGHKKCAKQLAATMWHTEKLLNFEQQSLNKRLKTQEVLLEIERAHSILHDAKKKSIYQFDHWLNTQSFIKPNSRLKPAESEPDLTTRSKEGAKGKPAQHDYEESIIKMSKADNDIIGGGKKTLSAKRRMFNSTEQSNLSELPHHESFNYELKQPSAILNTEQNDTTDSKDIWDYSTKVEEKTYIKNLDDFYPRDPYTRLPLDDEMLLLHHQLNGLTLEEIKEFMRKSLMEKAEFIREKQDKIEKAKTKNGKKKSIKNSAKSFKSDRPVYYKPKHVLDYESKAKAADDLINFTSAGFNLSDDPKTFPYQQSKRVIQKQQDKGQKNILTSIHDKKLNTGDEEYKKIISSNFSKELYDFMTTKNGKINPKYEKVFIC